MFAHLGKPFGRGEGEEIVAAIHRMFYLDRIGDDVIETLWGVGEALQLHLKAEAVAYVEEAAIMEPGECIAILIELVLISWQFAKEIVETLVFWRCLVFLVENIISHLGCQLQGAEQEWYRFLHITALLVMMPA